MQAFLLGFPWICLHLFGVAETPASSRDSVARYPTCFFRNSSVRVQASVALGAS